MKVKKVYHLFLITLIMFNCIFINNSIIYAQDNTDTTDTTEKTTEEEEKEKLEAQKKADEVEKKEAENKKKLTDKINKKIEENQKEIKKLENEMVDLQKDQKILQQEIPKLKKNANNTLKGLQKLENNNSSVLIWNDFISNNNTFNSSDSTLAYNHLLNAASQQLLVVAQKEKKLEEQQKQLIDKQNKIEDIQEGLRKEVTKILDENKLSQTYTSAQSATEKFYANNGCQQGDVYGIDCGKGNIKEAYDFNFPINDGYVTNEFGGFDIYNQDDGHTGMDLVNEDKKIYPMADGEVIDVFSDPYGGTQVLIIHLINGKNYISNYAHLDSFDVAPGQKVKESEQLGVMGDTGTALGVHLHFEIIEGPFYIHSKLENPRGYLDFPKMYEKFKRKPIKSAKEIALEKKEKND